jgi:ADP-ribosylglycohydrolase
MKNKPKDILFGIAIGDAIGVPYEFSSREQMMKNPAKDIVGYMSHNQPPGTWSDDSSLTFCLAESLINGYSLKSTAENFIKWKKEAYWTARGNVFDIGMTTAKAITKLEKIIADKSFDDLDLLKYESDEYDNGNGSLMRILPLIFEIKDKSITNQFEIIWKNSALTHGHIRSAMSCLIYLKFSEHLINGIDKKEAYKLTRSEIKEFWDKMNFAEIERKHFSRVIKNDICQFPKETILSGGYVIESLEASLWCFLKTETYESAVLKAINFGHDTDTTGAITGGLAGIYYGYKEIPEYWIASLAKMEKIEKLSERLNEKYNA